MAFPPSLSTNHKLAHNVVFTIPRTSSHLLLRVLNLDAQSHIQRHQLDGYSFLPALGPRFKRGLAGKEVGLWSEIDKDAFKDACQESYSHLESFLDQAETEGKTTFIKEHINWLIEPVAETRFLHPDSDIGSLSPFTIIPSKASVSMAPKSTANETILPDEVLLGLRPTFLIRNPMLTFPSLLRTSIELEGLETALQSLAGQRWEMTFHWSRALYEFYVHSKKFDRTSGQPDVEFPIVIDADDILNPEIMRKYAKVVGLDPAVIRYEWEKASDEEMEKLGKSVRRMKDTILGSTGIVEGKMSHGLVLEREVEKWKAEFGDVLGARLELLVREGMGDYEWLWDRRLRD